MKHQTQSGVVNLAHRCPICDVLVVRPAAILTGRWYCARHADQVPANANVLGIRESVCDCVDCPRFALCREWISDVCFN